MKLVGTIQSLTCHEGSADPRVKVTLSATASEYMLDRTKGNAYSRCVAEIIWIIPREYAESLHINQMLDITIRTHDSDMEKIERGEKTD